MSAYDGAAFVFPFLLVGAVGRVELKGFFHVLVSSPAVFLGLTFLEDVSSHDICVDGEVGHLCDSLSDFLALVVASLPLAVGCKRNGNDTVDVVEEVDFHSFLCQKYSQVCGNFRAVTVFQLIENVAGEGMTFVIEEGAGFLDGNTMPEHLCHLIIIRVFPCIGSGQKQIA